MKRFLILFIILIMFCSVCLWYQFHGYRFGYADETGKIVVPIKYNFVFTRPSINYDLYDNNLELMNYIGVDFNGIDYYNTKGFKYHTRSLYDERIGNISIKGFIKKIYYKGKLVARNTDRVIKDDRIMPYVRVNKYNDFTKANYLNVEDGTFLFPKFTDVEYKEGYYFIQNKDNTEIYDKKGVLISKVDFEACDVFDDLFICRVFDAYQEKQDMEFSDDTIYYNIVTKDGKKINDDYIMNYSKYNNNLYIRTKNGKPYVYNKEIHKFEKTHKDYIKLNICSCVYVHEKGKFGVIIDDYESPVIYDDILTYFDKEKSCLVKKDGKYGVIGPNTNIPCIYNYTIENPIYGLYRYSNSNNLSDSITRASYYYDSKPLSLPTGSAEITYGVLDSKGKEIVSQKYMNIIQFEKYIYAGDPKNNIYHIYDRDGKIVKTLSSPIWIPDASNLAQIIDKKPCPYEIGDSDYKVMDMNTLKIYNSIKDYVISKNPDNELLKDCDIYNHRHGFMIRYRE